MIVKNVGRRRRKRASLVPGKSMGVTAMAQLFIPGVGAEAGVAEGSGSLNLGPSTPREWTSVGPWPVRNQAAKQEVSE